MDGNTEGRLLRQEAAAFSFCGLTCGSAIDGELLDVAGDLIEGI